MADIFKPKHFPSLIVKVPGHGITVRRPKMALTPVQQAYLGQRGMVDPHPLNRGDEQEGGTSGDSSGEEGSNSPFAGWVVAGQPITPKEIETLVGFFNNPNNRTDGLKISQITAKTYREIEAARPLDEEAIAVVLSQAQIESAIKWLRASYLP